MNIAKRTEITSASTDPIQMGYHPIKVNNTVEKRAENEIVTSGLRPFVAIITVTMRKILKIREIMIPASVEVTPIAEAIPDRYSTQITILIKEGEGNRIFNYLDCPRLNQEPQPDQHYEQPYNQSVS